MADFARILWFFLRRRGLRAAWARACFGIQGYQRKYCSDCGGWKGRTSSTKCHTCVWRPVRNAVDTLFQVLSELD